MRWARLRDDAMMIGKHDLSTAAMALGVASYVAIILDCLARNELGLSDGQICKSAVFGAFVIAALLAAGSFRKEAGEAK
jgi:hypothetical protein